MNEGRGAAATLRDVARLAGVGESTASRVLRQSGSFSIDTRTRVLAAADSLGYVLNPMAGALASAQSRIVGVIVPSLGNAVFTDVLSGINSVLEAKRFQSLVGISEYSPKREEALIASLLAWRPAAIIVAGLEHTDHARALLRGSGVRVVELLDTDGDGIDFVVGFSNRAAGAASAAHLVERGYSRVGYVGHDLTSDLRAAKRHAGFSDALREAGLAIVDQEVRSDPSSLRGGRDGLAALLARTPDLDAIYFSNDDMAMGGYFHCTGTGIAVPERLALLGYNGLEIGQIAPRRLSTVLTARTKVGETAASLALSDAAPQVVAIPFELILGETT